MSVYLCVGCGDSITYYGLRGPLDGLCAECSDFDSWGRGPIERETGKRSAEEETHRRKMLREKLGRMVRAEWVRWAREQPNPKPSWLLPWEELEERDREVDRRIGLACYLYAFRDT